MRLIAKSLRKNGQKLARHPQLWTAGSAPLRNFLAETWSHTRDPLWAYVNKLNGHPSINQSLRDRNLSCDEYLNWSRAFYKSSVTPPWALIHLVTHRTHDSTDSKTVCTAVLSNLSSAPPQLIPSLLTLCTHTLADWQIVQILRPIVSRFLDVPHPIPYFQYHLFLKALSRFESSLEITRLITSVVDHLFQHGLELRYNTVLSLLESKARGATLARYLQKQLVIQESVPPLRVFEAFFRVFASRNATKLALHYSEWNQSKEKTQSFRRRFMHLAHMNSEKSTVLLNSFGNAAAAFQYLDLATSARGPSAFDAFHIRGWTSILALTAKGDKITSEDLLNLFGKIKEQFAPTAVTYTVLLRGLLTREDYGNAMSIWKEFLESGIPLDAKSLSAGIQIFTRSGSPLEAFRLLEKYAVIPGQQKEGRVALTPAFINVFMEQLLKVNRPDAVFALWEHAQTMYRVMPDTSMLNILLSTALIVGKYDETFTGFWAQFRAKMHTESAFFGVATREEIVASFETMLTKPMKATGMWDDTPAWQKAIRIFIHAVVGNNPALLHLTAPANALRASVDEMGRHPMKELSRAMMGTPDETDVTPIDLDDPSVLAKMGLYPLGAYPQVFPTAVTFHNYVCLLGFNNQAAQIPLALAWMRELGLLPMKRTVAMSLVFWAEVGLRAPLWERGGSAREGEYARFVRWLEGWLGLEKMPRPIAMRKASKRIARVREGFDFGK